MTSATPRDTKSTLRRIACRTRVRAPIRGVRAYAGPPGYWKVVLPAQRLDFAALAGIAGALWSGFIIKMGEGSFLTRDWLSLGVLSFFGVLGLGLLLLSAWLFLSRRSWLIGPDLLVVQEGLLRGFQTEWRTQGARISVCEPRQDQCEDGNGLFHGWELCVGDGRSVPLRNPPRYWNTEREEGYWLTLCDFGFSDRGARKADALGRWLAERTGWTFTSHYTERRNGVSVLKSKPSERETSGPCHYTSKCGGFELDLPVHWKVAMEEANSHMEWELPLVISTAGEPGCIVRVWVNRRPPQQRETVALLPGYGARGGTADLCLSAVPGAAFPAPAVLIEQYTSQVAKLSPGHTLTHAAEIIVAGQPAVLLAYTCDGSTDAQVGEISVCFPADAAIFQFEYMGPLTAIADLHDPLWSILRSFRPVAFAAAGTGKGLTEKGVRAARRPTRNSSRDRS